jgi:alpha-L-arabinofuranosidase
MIVVDPKPKFNLSPYLFMQFMEPLGTTDSSVEAAWDFENDCWRDDLIEVTRELAPGMIRLGGCWSSYYRWKEAVGPREKRVPMLNIAWGGLESNQPGTDEFVDFCRKVGAEPLICVNFESDGRKKWWNHFKAGNRSGGPEEAAEWVDYCNNPSNDERIKNGHKTPFAVKYWQIGNETSYDPEGYDVETAAKRTVVFADAMKSADPSMKLVAWGDSHWAKKMLEIAGEKIDYIAFHHHFDSGLPDSPLCGIEYRKDFAHTWEHLMNAYKSMEIKFAEMREEMAGSGKSLAMTEGHFCLPGRNRCEVLSSWAAGIANSRMLNVQQRNGDILKIATLADFCGTRWMVNAIITPTPKARAKAFMMPVASAMALYRKHIGEKAVSVQSKTSDLDVVASRTGNSIFIHVINVNRTRSIEAKISIKGMKILSGKVFEIANEPEREIYENAPAFQSKEWLFPLNGIWSFPPASVSALELKVSESLK